MAFHYGNELANLQNLPIDQRNIALQGMALFQPNCDHLVEAQEVVAFVKDVFGATDHSKVRDVCSSGNGNAERLTLSAS